MFFFKMFSQKQIYYKSTQFGKTANQKKKKDSLSFKDYLQTLISVT